MFRFNGIVNVKVKGVLQLTIVTLFNVYICLQFYTRIHVKNARLYHSGIKTFYVKMVRSSKLFSESGQTKVIPEPDPHFPVLLPVAAIT